MIVPESLAMMRLCPRWRCSGGALTYVLFVLKLRPFTSFGTAGARAGIPSSSRAGRRGQPGEWDTERRGEQSLRRFVFLARRRILTATTDVILSATTLRRGRDESRSAKDPSSTCATAGRIASTGHRSFGLLPPAHPEAERGRPQDAMLIPIAEVDCAFRTQASPSS